MAEGDWARETSRHRFVLGDLTNQIGECQSERNEIKKSSGVFLIGVNGYKRPRISPAMKGGRFSENRDPNIPLDETGASSLNIHKMNNFADPSTDKRDPGGDCFMKISTETVGCSKLDSLKEDGMISVEVVNENCPSKFQQDETEGDCEVFMNHCHAVEIENHDTDIKVLSQSGSVECTILHDSQESRVIASDVPYARHKKVHEAIPADIKSCSCSFCSKAAMMWLDIQQHDIKVRASAIKNSQREASVLAIKFSNKEAAVRRGDLMTLEMEKHLMHQWKSLFQRTSDVLEQETKELEASLGPLIELRNSYRRTRG